VTEIVGTRDKLVSVDVSGKIGGIENLSLYIRYSYIYYRHKCNKRSLDIYPVNLYSKVLVVLVLVFSIIFRKHRFLHHRSDSLSRDYKYKYHVPGAELAVRESSFLRERASTHPSSYSIVRQ
jgi:hypothetical protein